MTLSKQENIKSISGSGAESYSFDIPFFASSDLKCFVQLQTSEAPVELKQAADNTAFSGLTVGDGNGEFSIHSTDFTAGGTVFIKTFSSLGSGVALASGQTASIERIVPLTQEFDLQQGASIDPTALNTALDRTVAQSQQIDDKISKAITFPSTDSSSISYSVNEAAETRAGKVIGFDATGSITPLTVTTLSTGTATTVAGGLGIVNTDGTLSVNNDPDHINFDGNGKLKIATDGVTSTELADNAVDTAAITDLNVTTAKIANDAVDFTKMAHISANSVIGNATSGTATPAALTVQETLASTAGNLAYASAIKTYVDAQILKSVPRFVEYRSATSVLCTAAANTEGSGNVTFFTGASSTGTDMAVGNISSSNVLYTTKIPATSTARIKNENQILTIPLAGVTSPYFTVASANIVSCVVRVVVRADADGYTTDINTANMPHARVEYNFPQGQDSTSGSTYHTIGHTAQSEGNQYDSTSFLVTIPVNAAAGQTNLQFRVRMVKEADAKETSAQIDIKGFNVVRL